MAGCSSPTVHASVEGLHNSVTLPFSQEVADVLPIPGVVAAAHVTGGTTWQTPADAVALVGTLLTFADEPINTEDGVGDGDLARLGIAL